MKTRDQGYTSWLELKTKDQGFSWIHFTRKYCHSYCVKTLKFVININGSKEFILGISKLGCHIILIRTVIIKYLF